MDIVSVRKVVSSTTTAGMNTNHADIRNLKKFILVQTYKIKNPIKRTYPFNFSTDQPEHKDPIRRRSAVDGQERIILSQRRRAEYNNTGCRVRHRCPLPDNSRQVCCDRNTDE